MADSCEYDAPCWYVIQTKTNQEDRADHNLRAWGVETFAPKIREPRPDRSTGKLTHVTQHMFPRYIFARFRAGALLHKVCFTRGVHSVVSFGEDPCPVDDEIIRLIRSRRTDDGFIRLGEEPKPGGGVTIDKGYLENFTGVLEGKTYVRGRVTGLLTAVTYRRRVAAEQGRVTKDGLGHPSPTSLFKSPDRGGDARSDGHPARPA